MYTLVRPAVERKGVAAPCARAIRETGRQAPPRFVSQDPAAVARGRKADYFLASADMNWNGSASSKCSAALPE